MNTVIVGQGAIGLLCYHRFSQLKNNNRYDGLISLWPSKPTKHSHYSFSEITSSAKTFPLVIADEQALTRAQVVVICVKSYQVASALKTIHSLIADDAIIIVAHNGLGTLEEISSLLKPSQCLLALLLTQGAKKSANYHVEHTGIGNSDLGIMWGKISSVEQKQLVDYFQLGLKHVNWQENIQQAQWKKLAINCVINPLSALNNIENGKVNLPAYQEATIDILKEVVTVAAKEGVILSEYSLLSFVKEVANNTSANTSSMRADVLAERRTEIDYINGYIHRLGEKYQLATTKNTQLWQAVRLLEKHYLLK
jgi:2-dehydropantoate 2-reductase